MSIEKLSNNISSVAKIADAKIYNTVNKPLRMPRALIFPKGFNFDIMGTNMPRTYVPLPSTTKHQGVLGCLKNICADLAKLFKPKA